MMGLLTTTKRWGRRFLPGEKGFHGRNPPRVPLAIILGYHSIQPRPELYADTIGLGITHAASAFEAQMELIARQVKRGSYLFCPNGSHFALYDDQKTYMEGLIAFIRDVDSGRLARLP